MLGNGRGEYCRRPPAGPAPARPPEQTAVFLVPVRTRLRAAALLPESRYHSTTVVSICWGKIKHTFPVYFYCPLLHPLTPSPAHQLPIPIDPS